MEHSQSKIIGYVTIILISLVMMSCGSSQETNRTALNDSMDNQAKQFGEPGDGFCGCPPEATEDFNRLLIAGGTPTKNDGCHGVETMPPQPFGCGGDCTVSEPSIGIRSYGCVPNVEQ
jgi:hypothetical protein